MSSDSDVWPVSQEKREEQRARMASNLIDMAFARGASVSDSQAAEIAVSIDKKAFTVAQVESQTTTGSRPASETFRAYLRKLAALLLEAVEKAGDNPAAQAAQNVQAVDELDLTESEGQFLTAETAEELMAPALTPGAKIAKIKFSNNSFIPAAAEVAARAITNNSATLTHAVMSDIIAGRPESDALQALVILSRALATARLQALDLSGNALGEKGIRACAELWTTQPALGQLALQNVGLSIRACQALQELLKHPQHLQVLHFRNNMTDDAGAHALAEIVRQASGLREFRLQSSRVGEEGGLEIAAALGTGSSLISLELNDNPLGEAAAQPLSELIRRQPRLRVLNLSDTGLGDDGVCQIAEALSEGAPELEELELDLNEVTEQGAQALGRTLVTKSRLRKLSLRENELEDAGAVFVARSLALCNELQFLDLSANQLTAEGALAAVQAVSKKPQLSRLELNENQISNRGIAQIKEVLQSAGKADALGSLEDNEADDDDDDEDNADDMFTADAGSSQSQAANKDLEKANVAADALSEAARVSEQAAEPDSLADALASIQIK